MENQIQESAPCQPNRRRRLEPPQHNVSAQSLQRSRNAPQKKPQWLPLDIILEILQYLPVQSLLRFRCVSKYFGALIMEPSFIKMHLKRNQENPKCFKNRVFIYTSNIGAIYDEYSIHASVINSIFEDPVVRTDETKYKGHIDWIVGSCNGLICRVTGQDTVFLINPVLRVFKRLPDLGAERRNGGYADGFGFDASKDDYKVVRIFCYDQSYENVVLVYSLRDNSWKRIQDCPFEVPVIYDESGKHVDGCLNWLCLKGSSSTIVSLDLAEETFKEVMQPCYGDGVEQKYYKILGILDGCLCVLCECMNFYDEIWVMKEYGKKESWSKLVTIPFIHYPGFNLSRAPIFVSESGEILLQLGSNLVIYNPKEKSCRIPVIANVAVSFIEQVEVFVESLVSPIVVNQLG